MKKTAKFLSLLSVSALLGLTLTNTVYADGVNPLAGDSKATVGFTVSENQNDIANPTDPTKPVDPNKTANPDDSDNKGTGAKGSLTIDYVSNFNFGKRAVSSKNEDYSLASNGTDKEKNPFVQVTDNRGTQQGWNLTAKITDFQNKDDAANPITLVGAQITIVSTSDKAKAAFDNPNKEPTNTTPLTLSNDARSLISAAQGTGGGTWINLIDPNNTKLSVPGGRAQPNKNYSATITWGLSDGPQN